MTGRKNHPLAARIKRLMQKDEDVGRIAQATPILIGRAMELFLKKLCNNIATCAKLRHARTVTTGHLKAYVLSDDMMDFLNDIVRAAPDLTGDDRQHNHRVKRQRPQVGSVPKLLCVNDRSSIGESSIEPRVSVGGLPSPTPPRRRSQTPQGAAPLGTPPPSQSDAASTSHVQVVLTPSLDRSQSCAGSSTVPGERCIVPTGTEGTKMQIFQTSGSAPAACSTPGDDGPGSSAPVSPPVIINLTSAANPQPSDHQEDVQSVSTCGLPGLDGHLIPKPITAAVFSSLKSPFQQAPEVFRPESRGGVQAGRMPSGPTLRVSSIGVPGMPAVPAEDDDYDVEEGEEEGEDCCE